MKPKPILSSFLLILALNFAVSPSLLAEIHSLDWFTIDGGGNASSGQSYSLTGTIGQSDAGPSMLGGDFELTGGFWSIVGTPDTLPTLSIELAPDGRAKISWIPSTPGYVLQETPELARLNWKNTTEAASNPQFVPTTSTARYYRLQKP